MQADQLEPSLTPGSLGKLGMWSFLAGDAMTFGAAIARLRRAAHRQSQLAVAGSLPRHHHDGDHDVHSDLLERHDGRGASAQTGRMARYRNFMALTVLGGLLFLGMQAFEWHHLLGEKGMSIKVDPSDATSFPHRLSRLSRFFGGVVYNSATDSRHDRQSHAGEGERSRSRDCIGISSTWFGSPSSRSFT